MKVFIAGTKAEMATLNLDEINVMKIDSIRTPQLTKNPAYEGSLEMTMEVSAETLAKCLKPIK